MAFDGCVNALALVSRNFPYIPDRGCPLLIPRLFQPISIKTIIPAMPRKSSRIFIQHDGSAPSCARVSVNRVASRFLGGRRLPVVPTVRSSAEPPNPRIGLQEPPATAASNRASSPSRSTAFCWHPSAQAPEPAQIPCYPVQRARPPMSLAAPKHL